MSCDRCRVAVSAILDGEELPEDVFVARHHLPRCAACRAAADRAMEITLIARAWTDDDAPDVVPSVLAALQAGPDTDAARRPPSCAETRGPLQPVGNATCGCSAGCACGCQDGAPCRCGNAAA